jgi:glycosyltransferase involved in cell wall biosynthesis
VRVLHVNDEPLTELGGVSRYLERLLPAQEALGVQTRLLTGLVEHHGWRRVLDFWDPAARRAVEQEVDAWHPDVVHLHSVLRECSVSVTALRRQVPVVLSVHDPKILGETEHGDRRLLELVDRRVKSPFERAVARRHVTRFAPVSEELTARCVAAGLRPATWLPGPTLLPAVPPPPPSNSHDVVFAGRFAPDKGVLPLLQAWELLAPRFPASRLHLLGDGPEAALVADRARQLGASVVLAGPVGEAQVAQALAAARVVVAPYQPSLRQASSLVTLEGAAAGRPVVVGDDPAVVEILERLGAGTAVDATRPELLADALAAYLEDGARADAEGGTHAASVGRWYSPEAVARRSLELYAEVCVQLTA